MRCLAAPCSARAGWRASLAGAPATKTETSFRRACAKRPAATADTTSGIPAIKEASDETGATRPRTAIVRELRRARLGAVRGAELDHCQGHPVQARDRGRAQYRLRHRGRCAHHRPVADRVRGDQRLNLAWPPWT